MLVKHIPSGLVMDTDMATFQAGPSTPARTPLEMDTQPADIAYIGVRQSGTLLAITGYTAKAYLVWRTINDNRILQQWPMDSVAATATAVDNLLAAYSTAPAATVSVTLSSAGVVTAV